jgi:hypothetical protein
MSKRLLIVLTAMVLSLLPGLALAAPEPIALAQYQARLSDALNQLEAARGAAPTDAKAAAAHVALARPLLDGQWQVSAGSLTAASDLRPVAELLDQVDLTRGDGPNRLDAAISVVKEHQAAAEALGRGEPASFPDARARLDKALASARAEQRGLAKLMEWLIRLFSGEHSPGAAVSRTLSSRWLQWLALAVGLIGTGFLARGLFRSLAGNAAGAEVGLGTAGKRRPDHLLTPEELWQAAGTSAALGDYKEGLRLAHLSLLKHLDRVQLLRYDPALTNREHERLLRRQHPNLARSMHALTDLVESRLFSGHGATAEDFERGTRLAEQLWREGDDASKSAQATNGASSSASSR